MIVSISISSSARMIATQSGWMIYGSPDFLRWFICASLAISKARFTRLRSSLGRYLRIVFTNSSYRSSGLVKSAGVSSSISIFFSLLSPIISPPFLQRMHGLPDAGNYPMILILNYRFFCHKLQSFSYNHLYFPPFCYTIQL